MSNILKVRSIEIGAGKPKVVVSIIERNFKEIIAKALNLREMQIDIIEWRADFYDEISNLSRTLELLTELRSSLGEIPLLFTFRTKKEGGEKDISIEQYANLNIAVATGGKADLIDIEMFSDKDMVAKIIKTAHDAGTFVVGSNHDFNATPYKDEIIRRMIKMQEMDADIIKIAVMPKCKKDVLTLLAATNEMHEYHAYCPIVTVSMAQEGIISRFSGEIFGSAMTFASVGSTSAPGQIPVNDLVKILDIVHKYSVH
ncbi:MAG: type I 3-dehydroquinate dehydratase [Defluviitaleaceae bacterium]|nr:type I 3-dehydroquinate dehydratase [Defluviitaleaceae bacterium]